MPTLVGRKAVRLHLAALLKADIDNALSVDTLVEGHEPKETAARSPIITVHGAGSRFSFTPYAYEYHRLWITWYWLRDDPALSEDRFDDLSLAIYQSLFDHITEAGYWSDLLFGEDFSEAAYITLDGRQYRTERAAITIQSICNNQ